VPSSDHQDTIRYCEVSMNTLIFAFAAQFHRILSFRCLKKNLLYCWFYDDPVILEMDRIG